MSEPLILIVDDDPDILELTTLVLEEEGHRVVVAGDGLEALARVAEQHPDLILLDMRMPIMSGWEFAAEFRSLYGDATPILVITAAEDAKKQAMEVAADDYLSKPFEIRELLRKAHALIDRRSSNR